MKKEAEKIGKQEKKNRKMETAEKTIVEARLEYWNRKIKEVNCRKITAGRRKIYVDSRKIVEKGLEQEDKSSKMWAG